MDTLMALLVVMVAASATPLHQPAAQKGGEVTSEREHVALTTALKSDSQKRCNIAGTDPCVRAKEARKLTGQREKAKICNRQAAAKKLKGFDRLDYVTSCVQA